MASVPTDQTAVPTDQKAESSTSSNDTPILPLAEWLPGVTVATYKAAKPGGASDPVPMVNFYVADDGKLRTTTLDADLTSTLSRHACQPSFDPKDSSEWPWNPMNGLELAFMVSLLLKGRFDDEYPGLKELVGRLGDLELERLAGLGELKPELSSTVYFLNVLLGVGRGELEYIGRLVYNEWSEFVGTVPGQVRHVKMRAMGSKLGAILGLDYWYWHKKTVFGGTEAQISFRGLNQHVRFQSPKNGRQCGLVSELEETWDDVFDRLEALLRAGSQQESSEGSSA
ncbi:hypothetical protein Z517_09398 [Fonsecaea pedrosoi CBS 271.37]|uniref:Uncharacterized protein n=1 Tax=Fonsecaea pedrosoi CBS 271.37 TaxID=1442368 RepID=A0A0D2GXA7_9EURO|nr:uncharacterized protein Z517_09398 [Fonsecaea pedrosoi CBS 271.37]KIW76954.1 hypothetical protein Z517_09398 [Fonsecaea pedrosoi CBS 271.37]